MKQYFVSLLMIMLMQPAFACINVYRTLLDGRMTDGEPGYGRVIVPEIDVDELRTKADALKVSYEKTGSIQDRSDYAAALTYLGEYDEALKIYLEIEKNQPGLYTTASNLGTLYELTGKPDLALQWIKKSVELNPDSHEGSEWIHIKILEFKINQSPDYYARSILGLNFGADVIPSNPENYDLPQLQNHIWHQLSERERFVKVDSASEENKEIVGNIYFDLGNILAQTSNLEAALESYQAAKDFGFESNLMDQRIAKFKAMTFKASLMEYLREKIRDPKFSLTETLIMGLVLFSLLGLMMIFIRRRKSRRLKTGIMNG